MFRFFSKIRQQLLTESKFSKYLVYAIGEIVLVVIGILIALSINNWNEEKKLHKEEQKLIDAVVKEIESNIQKLEEAMTVNKSCVQRSNTFIEGAVSDENFQALTSDIIVLFCYTGNEIDDSILNEILGTNSRSLISNDQHLNQLRVLNLSYDRLEKTMNYVDAFWNNTVIDYFNSSGVGVYTHKKMRSKYKEKAFIPDNHFLSVISMMNGFQEALINRQEDLQQALKDTSEFLN